MGCCCSDDALWSTESTESSFNSTESECQHGAGESCIPLSPARLYLICGALCFKRKGAPGYMPQFCSDLLEQAPIQTKYNCAKSLLQCFQVRMQQTFTFKFLLLCFHAVHWSCPLPAPQSRSGLNPRGCLAQTWIPAPMGQCTHSTVPCSESLPLLPVWHQFLSAMQVKTFWGELCSITSKICLGVCFLLLGCGCFNLTKVQDAAAISPGWLMVSGGWSPGQVGRGRRNKSFSAWRREGQGRDCTCCPLPHNGLS